MSFRVVWLDSHILCWDQAFVDETLLRLGGEPVVGFENLPVGVAGAVVVVPARYHVNRIDELNDNLARLDWAVVILTSDEESTFPYEKITHRNVRTWVQTPRPGVNDTVSGGRYLPFVWPPDTRRILADAPVGRRRRFDWSFAGQVNHPRRRAAADAFAAVPGGRYRRSPGFTKGLERAAYLRLLADSKTVLAPSGPATPDSFRWAETLEAGAVPITDGRCPAYDDDGYWRLVLGGPVPFPVVNDWAEGPAAVAAVLNDWPATGNRTFAWWQAYKRRLRSRIAADIRSVGGSVSFPAPATVAPGEPATTITVLIPTSPTPTDPDTTRIEETVASVRYWLPDAELVVMIDGVRPEQEHRRTAYEEYQRRLLFLINHRFGNAFPVRFDTHQHQANMTREALRHVSTPLVLFVEHDTPLVVDEPIDFPALTRPLLADDLDMIRLHHEAVILEVHEYLMVDETPKEIDGCPVYRTSQWSQRPHLARTAYYRSVIARHFPATASTMIEDKMHSVAQTTSWSENRLAVYAPAPPGGNIKRSLHSDGRGNDPKYGMRFR